MGMNCWSDIEERKRRETETEAGQELPGEGKGGASSRLEASESLAEDEEKRRVVEKLKDRESYPPARLLRRLSARLALRDSLVSTSPDSGLSARAGRW